jgi:hypothetical protein
MRTSRANYPKLRLFRHNVYTCDSWVELTSALGGQKHPYYNLTTA